MYVTMMMTDQLMDLAPPPLLNGELPLMQHMVNGDAAQQVGNTNTHAHCTNAKRSSASVKEVFPSSPSLREILKERFHCNTQ